MGAGTAGAPPWPTLLHAVLARADAEPQLPLAAFGRRPPLSLSSLVDALRGFAAALANRGVRSGDRVLVALDNSPEFIVSWLGSSYAGAVVVPVVPSAGDRVFRRAWEVTRPAIAVAGRRGLEPVRRAAGGHDLTVIGVDDDEDGPALSSGMAGFLSEASADPGEPRAAGAELASVMFTSGTTGPPKGVCLSHLWYVWASLDIVAGMGYTSDDVLYTCLPLGHANAQDTTFGPAVLCGGRVAFDTRFSAASHWVRLRDTGATAFNLIGNMPRTLLNRDPGEHVAGRARRAFAIPALPELRRQFERRFGVALLQGYGTTEIGVPVFQDEEAVRRGSCGLVADGVELMIACSGGEPAGVGDVGEICVRTQRPGAVTDGYFGEPQRSSEAWRAGWFRTGDLGRVDGDGHLYFMGRLGELYRRKGESVAAHAVESALLELSEVEECAVVGWPGDGDDDELLAFVVPADGAALSADALAAHCARALGPAAVPTAVRCVERLPRTESGKVAKGRLREQLEAGRGP